MPFNPNIPPSLQWNQLALEAIKHAQTPLPMAARALALVHTAMYNAWAVYDGKAMSTNTGKYLKKKGSRANKQKTFSYAAYRVLTELFRINLPAEKKNMFLDLLMEMDYDPDDTSLDASRSQGVGNLATKLILESGMGDGSNAHGTLSSPAWSDYTGYNNKDESKENDFLVPHWGLLRTFSLDHNSQYRPSPPYKQGQSQYKEQAKEMVQASAGLTDKQKVMAEYWCGSPENSVIVKWFEIAQFIAENHNYENKDCIKLFFGLANALHDATVACWDCMRYYDAERPGDIIHDLYKGREIKAWAGSGEGNQSIKGEEWQPYIEMPPYPGYVSVQSTLSAAAAVILRRYTGSDQFKGYTIVEKGNSSVEKGFSPKSDVKLEWATFTEAAKEAGRAGFYGGISFPQADEEGHELGKSVGQCVWKKTSFYFND